MEFTEIFKAFGGFAIFGDKYIFLGFGAFAVKLIKIHVEGDAESVAVIIFAFSFFGFDL